MFARPRSSNSRLTSRRMTETPRELSHCAIPEPITPAPITARVHNFLGRRFRRSFPVFVGQEKIADQVLGRFGLRRARRSHRARAQRFVDRAGQRAINDHRRRGPARHFLSNAADFTATLDVRRRRFLSVFPGDFLSRGFEQLFARNHFIDQSELQRFAGRIKFPFQNHFAGGFAVRSNAADASRPPQAGTSPSVVSGKPIRVAGSSDATR